MRYLRSILAVIGVTQIGYGAMYLIDPAAVAGLLHVGPAAPPWVDYVLTTAGARFIGYGIGMLAAARAPHHHRLWIDTMIAIQAVDFIATLAYLAHGVLPGRHFAATAALPLLWIVVLTWTRLRTRGVHPPTYRARTQKRSIATGSR